MTFLLGFHKVRTDRRHLFLKKPISYGYSSHTLEFETTEYAQHEAQYPIICQNNSRYPAKRLFLGLLSISEEMMKGIEILPLDMYIIGLFI